MKEFRVNVRTPDGMMDCFVCHPEGEALPAVLFYMDVPGIREELRDMCRHIAEQGYVAILPDLYYRHGEIRFDLSKGEEELNILVEGTGLHSEYNLTILEAVNLILEEKNSSQEDESDADINLNEENFYYQEYETLCKDKVIEESFVSR